MAKSTTIQKVTTPKGELQWVNIAGEGKENLSGKMQYVANIAFNNDDPEFIALKAKVDAFWDGNRPKKVKKPKSTGFYPEMRKTDETDEDGEAIKEATGRTVVAFKTGTTWPDGSTTLVKTYNARAKEVQLGDTKIGNGSIGQISGAFDIYFTRAPGGSVIIDAGVTFYLNSIKISKLVEYGEDTGFEADDDADEEGWTGDEGWTGEEPAEAGTSKPRL